jgi:CHAT domain
MEYNDFILKIEGTWEDGFYITPTHRYFERGSRKKRDLAPFPFNAAQFFHEERHVKVFEEIQLAIHRQPFDEQMVHNYGAELFNSLFSDAIKNDFENARDKAYSAERRLRIQLHLPGLLQVLPWELMLMGDTPPNFLCLNTDLSLIRLGPEAQTDVLTAMEFPLRILVVASTPLNRPPLDARGEMDRLLKSLKDLIRTGKAEVDFIHGADTLAGLKRRLRNPYHILHYIGHSSDEAGPVSLMLEDAERNAKKMNAMTLLQRLGGLPLPSLVFLNACKGAAASPRVISPLTSIAEGFINVGATAVIAHQFEISDEAAMLFARSVYDALVDGTPLEESINAARYELKDDFPLEWVTPVFFSRNTGEPVVLQQDVKQSPAPKLSYFVEQARQAFKNRRWSEAADYAYVALLIQENDPELRCMLNETLQHEQLDSYVHHAAVHRSRKNWDEVADWCERYLESSLSRSPQRSDRARVVSMKLETYVHRGKMAERTGNWGDAANWYEQCINDPAAQEQSKLEQERMLLLMRVAQLGTGFCDPYLRWKG